MKDIVKPIAVLASICLVVTALLAFVNSVTSPIIQKAAEEKAAAARSEVLGEANGEFDTLSDEDMEKLGLPAEITEVSKAKNGSGAVISVTVKGYGGDIKLMLGIKSDGSIEKIYTLEHSETSGIGSRVVDNKSGYSDNYIGKTEDSYSEVDAISGATISSKAYKKAISIAYEGFDIVKEAA